MITGESASAFTCTNARSIALVGAYMANKGTFQGKQMISEDTWNKFHADPTKENMDGYYPTAFNKGGAAVFGMEGGNVTKN